MMTGVAANTRPWTPEENEILRAAYTKGGLVAARAALPYRTEGALYHHANRIGAKRRRRWTKADDEALRFHWEDGLGLTAIGKRLGRTPLTTYWRARKIGLQPGCPDGFEYLEHSATRTGYARDTLHNILTWAGVTMHRAMSRPEPGRSYHMRIVDPFKVDDAIEAWCKTEPVEAAARRLGIGGDTLRRRLRAAGIADPRTAPKVHWRVREDEIARAVGR